MRKEIRALQAIGYYFPVDKAQLVRTLEDISFEHLSQMRSVYRHEYEFGMARMNALVDSVIHSICEVCDEEQTGYGDIPKGWGWYDGKVKHYLMCTDCQKKYEKKYGTKPKIRTTSDDN